jgi:SAM-dependent methyltransferase
LGYPIYAWPMPKNQRSPGVRRTARPIPYTAKTADRHTLYEASVQDTSTDIAFIDRVFRKRHKRLPTTLREDFCGTGRLCADWVATRPERHAIGLDLHRPTMRWGEKRHIAALDASAQGRVKLQQGNVLDGIASRVDVTVAFNFSYCVFKQRAELLRYFKRVHHDLHEDGLFFLDIHGGTEVFEEMEETTAHKGFTYVWDQAPYDAITGLTKRYIHFRFPDGSQMQRAFSYDWRLWHLPEMREVLLDAGFRKVEVYWEGADADGTGDGKFKLRQRAENELSWIAYIVAVR